MGGPGNRTAGDDLAPMFSLTVEGTKILSDLSQFVKKVEYESALDMADVLTITVNNPGFLFNEADKANGPDWGAHKAFQPGNEVDLHIGYGRADTFIGRVQLVKHLPDFPQDGVPSLVIKGYDKSHQMMEASGPVTGAAGGKLKKLVTAEDEQGTLYADMTASDIVEKIASKYGFYTNVEATSKKMRAAVGDGIVQKKGMTDYELVKMLANLNDRELTVDYHPLLKRWYLNWVSPETGSPAKYDFKYGQGELSTLLSYNCEYGIRENVSDLVVLAFDKKRREWVSVAIVEDVEGPQLLYKAGGGRMERAKPAPVRRDLLSPTAKRHHKSKEERQKEVVAVQQGQEIRQALSSATEFRLSAGGVAIDVVDRQHATVEDAADFAKRWFQQRKDSFIVAKGKLIGVEDLRARQVHRLSGLGSRLSGDYYFISVNHSLDDSGGYTCEFTARKILD